MEGASTLGGHTHEGTNIERDIDTEGAYTRRAHRSEGKNNGGDVQLKEQTYGGDGGDIHTKEQTYGEMYKWWSIHRWSVQTLRIAFKRAAITSLPHNLDKSAVVKIFEGII